MFKIYGITVKIQRSCGEQGTKLTFLPYVVKALVSALKNTRLNTSFNEEVGEIVHKHYWNIGIAAILTEAY